MISNCALKLFFFFFSSDEDDNSDDENDENTVAKAQHVPSTEVNELP